MRKTGNAQHYFTVRGRGFDLKQWSRVLSVANSIVDRAKGAGFKPSFDGNAREMRIEGPGIEGFLVVRKGEPDIPKEVRSSGRGDVLVQTVMTAIKKIAPDIFVMASPDGRDYRRLFAKTPAQRGEGAWSRMKRLDHDPKTKEEAFLRAMSKQKWRHPETRNQVEFVSLPKAEQTKLRKRWEQEFGDQYQRALDTAKEEAEEAHKELQDAGKAVSKADREKEKAERAKGLEEAYEKTLQRMANWPAAGRKAEMTMNDEIIRKAAIRVAHSTHDTELKRKILDILRPTVEASEKEAKDDGEKESRHEEGKSVDVGTWLKNNGYAEAAQKWEKHEGEVEKKASSKAPAKLFPAMHKLAWHHVLAFAKANPQSKVSSGSTADRVAAADALARKWIVNATDSVQQYAETSPEDLDAAISKAAAERNTAALYTLHFAKALRGFTKKVSADDQWLTREAFTKAATEVWGSEHLAKKWIQDAIERPGRVREYLGIPEGEDIPEGKLDSAIKKVKGEGNKSLLSALLLAKRLKKMHGKK